MLSTNDLCSRLSKSLVLIVVLLVSAVEGLIDADGVCSVFSFVPFTKTWDETNVEDAGGLVGDLLNSYGFSHMAAALLAQDHFNSRNASMIPELGILKGCNVTLDLEDWFIDSGSVTKVASKRLARQSKIPCAIAGPFNDYPGSELSVMAQAYEFPLVTHRAFSPRISSNFYSSFTSQVFPDLQASTETLVDFLIEKGRTNYTAMLYSQFDTNIARRELLTYHLDKKGIDWMASAYITPLFSESPFASDVRTPYTALKQIKDSGYRTIVVALEFVYVEVQAIADAAEALGMNSGDYFWVWFDIFEPAVMYPNITHDTNTNITKLGMGSAWIVPLSDAILNLTLDFFGQAWYTQGKSEVDRLNEVNPIDLGDMGFRLANDTFFQDVQMDYGTSFMYDAVMSIGIGACLANRTQDGLVLGADHVAGIRASNFEGASGRIRFGNNQNDPDRIGVRLASTITWGVFNLRHPSFDLPDNTDPDEEYIALTALKHPNSTTWEYRQDFLYRDLSTEAPLPLRKTPDQHYLNRGLRAVGLTLMSMAMFFAVLSAIGVFICRKHRVVKASQPLFLYLICFGASIQASTILTLSFDESYGQSDEQLTAFCMSMPWLLSLGHIIIYSALFTKMWRVHKVLQFSRRQVKIRHVAWPMLFLVLCDLLLLSLWTALDPVEWNRVVTDPVTGASIGECMSDHAPALWSVLLVLLIAPMITTGVFAWKTRDVDEAYTESKYVFMMILLQVEVMLIGVPIAVLLRDVSTNGRYLGYAFMFWTFPMSTLGFIILPKYLAYRRAVKGLDDQTKPKRGEQAHGRVSGWTSKETEDNLRRTPESTRNEVPSSQQEVFAPAREETPQSASQASKEESLPKEATVPDPDVVSHTAENAAEANDDEQLLPASQDDVVRDEDLNP